MRWCVWSKSYVIILSIFVLLLRDADAALVELDLITEGDKLITHDTATNLEWLDLKATEDLYYPYVKLHDQGGWQAAGWRFATTADVRNLLSVNTGLEEGVWGIGEVQTTPLKNLMDLFGIMYVSDPVGSNYFWRNYVAFNDGTENGWVGRAFMQVTFDGTIATKSMWLAQIDGFTDSNSGGPIFFVREHPSTPAPVPLPPSSLLFGTGLIGCFGYIRSKLRRI